MSSLPPSESSEQPLRAETTPKGHPGIRTPDQRVRVFVSSTLQELAPERAAARDAIARLRLTPVMFELGARPHPPRTLYRAYLQQSDIFVGIYWQRYGWVAPDMTISGLEDEYRLCGDKPKLIYIKQPAPDREPRLQELINDLQVDGTVSYKSFSTADEIRDLLAEDLAIMLSERFEMTRQAAMPHEESPEEAVLLSGSLPVFRSAIVGREVELVAAREMLLRPDTGLLTLIGAGGTGKTRLGVQLATNVQQEFKDGVRFVALDSLATPDLVLPAIGSALAVMETGDTPLLESLKAELAGKQVLLVLDNFEHLAAAAPDVNALLDACVGLKVLVTSRRALRVRGEREFPVPPLDLPDPERPEDVQQLSQCAAVQLFIERARDVRPDFELTEENGPAVADICRRLDGLPLAIELAAARVKILPPRAMLRRLSGGLELLTGGPRDLPARQQTLSNAIAWSYALLEAPEQQLFSRLAVFAGGFTFEACEMVCSAGSDLATGTFDSIFSLVENSLVTLDDGGGAEPRFALLRTIRDYATERLAASGEEKEIRRRHALYYRDLALQAEAVLSTAEQDMWMRRLGKEQDNLRAALEWCLAQKERQSAIVALSIAGCQWRFWYISGHLSEGRRWLERTLEGVDRTTGSEEGEHGIAALKAKALKGLGNLAYWQTDYPAARSVYDAALAINRELGNEKEVASLLNNLGNVNAEMGRPDEARWALEESLALARRTGYDALVTMVLGNLAGLAIDRGDYQRGRADTEEALELERAAGNLAGIAQSLTNLGIISVALGEYSRAHHDLAEALELLHGLSDDFSLAFAIDALGSLACDEGDYERARAHHLQALAIRLELGHKWGVIECLRGLAEVAVAIEDFERAARIYGAAEALREEVGASFVHSSQERYGRFTATGQAQMGAAAWEKSSREGSRLSLEQAVVLARGDG